jgi:hypothetical protein
MATGYLQTYGSTGGAAEDILDLITQITPTDTPFLSRLGVSRAYASYHEWLTDFLTTSGSTGNALVEGESALEAQLTDKTRYNNYTQISDRTFIISGTEEAVSHYGLDSQYSYQLEKAMKELKIKMEKLLLGNGTANSGAGASARIAKGAMHFIASAGGNTASGAASVSALTESIYNTLAQAIYEDGGNPDTTFVNGFNKRRISAFASNNSRFLDMKNNKKLTGIISVYESDFGTQEIVLDRYLMGISEMTNTGADKGCGLMVEMSKLKIAYLRKPFTNPLSTDGDRKKVQILTEYTLECLAPTQQGVLSAFATA